MARRLLSLLPHFLLLAACSSQPNGNTPDPTRDPLPDAGVSEPVPSPPHASPPVDEIRTDGMFVRAAHVLPGGGFLLVYERPIHTKERWGRPLRSLVWANNLGASRRQRLATDGRELIDVAVHPSGNATVLETSDEGYFLVRLDAHGTILDELRLVDDAILTDPPTITPSESRAPIEQVTHDAARVVADGEGVFLGTRTGRHSVVAYRVGFDQRLSVEARTLVVPPHAIVPTALNGGTYDTFGQLDAHYGVFVAVETGGSRMGFVGVGHARLEHGFMVKAHAKVFGEQLVTDVDWLDTYVTRVSATGERLGTSVVGTPHDEQLYALRATANAVYALGRSEPENTGGVGFDGFVARIDTAGVVATKTFDVDRGDIAFDLVVPDEGGLIIVGASGYSQNPAGASISEESHTFARWLRSDGRLDPLPMPDGPRHSEVRFIVEREGKLYAGGMLDGPGTHSADGDLALLRANAFFGEVSKPVER
jgi:hypothetical protein